MSTKQTEALKLALEALEPRPGMPNPEYESLTQCAITALREALAEQPAQQEPVAWRWKYKFKDIGETGAYEYHSHEFACLTHMPKGEPLYTSPPPQRTWVGLTDEEIDVAWNNCEAPYGFAEDIEAKLKEKNT